MGSIDPAQFRHWFDAHSPSMVLYARQWVDAGLADDMVQDVFIRLMSLPRPPDNVRAWLFRMVRYAALNGVRASRRRKRHEHGASARQEWFEHRPDDLIDAGAAQDALQELPPPLREVVVLRIWGALTLKEIAEILAVPVTTVHSRYHAGLAEVRKRMVSPCKKNI